VAPHDDDCKSCMSCKFDTQLDSAVMGSYHGMLHLITAPLVALGNVLTHVLTGHLLVRRNVDILWNGKEQGAYPWASDSGQAESSAASCGG
jgi:hypothetical protein